MALRMTSRMQIKIPHFQIRQLKCSFRGSSEISSQRKKTLNTCQGKQKCLRFKTSSSKAEAKVQRRLHQAKR